MPGAIRSRQGPIHPRTKPAAMSIPKEGYFNFEQGRYGPVFPRTPANYGFTVIAKVKPGRENAIREYGKTIEEAVKDTADVCQCTSTKLRAATKLCVGLRHRQGSPGRHCDPLRRAPLRKVF